MLHHLIETFLESFPYCKDQENMLFFKYKDTSSKEDPNKDEDFPIYLPLI